MESINIVLTAETIQAGMQKHMDDMFTLGNYNHPVKKILDAMFSEYNNKDLEVLAKLRAVVKDAVLTKLDSPEFQLLIQQAIASEVAKKAAAKRWENHRKQKAEREKIESQPGYYDE